MQQDTSTALAQREQKMQEKPQTEQTPITPVVDVTEDSSGITMYADLPGVPKDQLSLQINGDTLTIEGMIELGTPAEMEVVHAEVSLPRYQRVFTLSKELDTDKVEAQFEAGVLRLRIPKAQHAQPRRIEVQVS